MRLLFDNNLSPALPRRLESMFPGSRHCRSVASEAATDRALAILSVSQGFVLVTKDSDFESLTAHFPGLRIVTVVSRNARTDAIETALREAASEIRSSLAERQVYRLEVG